MLNNILVEELSYKYINDVFLVGKLSLEEAWSRDALSKELQNDLAKYFVAIKSDEVIGFAGMWIIAGEADITNIAVHPDHRHEGIGTLVTSSLMDYCLANSISSITLEVRVNNTTAINMYKKLGFVEEGVRKKFYADGEDALIMWKRDI